MADQHLIMAQHTTDHWPTELYLPSAIVDRDNRENWLKAGGLDTYQRACLETDRRLAAYRPIETDPAVDAELRRIITSGLVSQTELPVLPPAPEPAGRPPRRRRPARRRGPRSSPVNARRRAG